MTFGEVAAFQYRHETEERIRWQHTATICALLVNINKGKGKPPTKPADFYPYDIPTKESENLDAQNIKDFAESMTKNLKKRNGSDQ
jgi:hypothetical protein